MRHLACAWLATLAVACVSPSSLEDTDGRGPTEQARVLGDAGAGTVTGGDEAGADAGGAPAVNPGTEEGDPACSSGACQDPEEGGVPVEPPAEEPPAEVPTAQQPPAEEPPADAFACPPLSFDNGGTLIGGGSGFEPSGAVWHERLQRLFVASDNGLLLSMSADGSAEEVWDIGGDLEGVTVASAESDFLYIGLEDPDSILELQISSVTVTRVFDLTPWMGGDRSQGLEALTFVTDPRHPEGGLFYAGHQGEGAVYVFEAPIRTSSTSTDVAFITTLTPLPGQDDISGMHYDPDRGLVHALFDSADLLVSMTPDGEVLSTLSVPYDDQEGIAQAVGCDLFIAEDTGAVRRFGQPR